MCSMRGKVAVKDSASKDGRWAICNRTARSISQRVRLGPAAENRKKSSQPRLEKGPRSPKRVDGSLF